MDYRGMTVAEIDEMMVELKEARKLAVKAEQAKVDARVREYLASLEKGDILTVVLKDEKVEGTFVGLTDKRFTVEIDGVKKSIMYSKLVM